MAKIFEILFFFANALRNRRSQFCERQSQVSQKEAF